MKKNAASKRVFEKSPGFFWERICVESQISALLEEWLPYVGRSDLVLLEGELGVGKSTFANFFLQKLKIPRVPEGSPTFALMHEYQALGFPEIVHIDLYRIESERELEESGIQAALWEREALVLMEWAERFPAFWRERRLGKIWKVRLDFVPEEVNQRKIQISKLDHSEPTRSELS